jgi:Glycosyl-transferase for dystroglycan
MQTMATREAIHPIANAGVPVRRSLSPLRQVLLTMMILLGTGYLIGTFVSMGNMKRYLALSIVQSTHPTNSVDGDARRVVASSSVNASSLVKVIRKADKAELVKRFQKLVDEQQQDVIENVFTPVEKMKPLNSITCATQGGLNKLPRLIALTSRWLGPVSFSAVVNSEHDLDVLFQFWTDNPLIQEYVSLHLLMELPQLQRSENARYPINQLRNLALHNVKTEYVFLNDVDFIPSDHAHDEIAALIQDFSLPAKTFWVLPAFERLAKANTTNPEEEVTNVEMIPRSKPELLKAIHHDMVVLTFHSYVKPAHGPTDFEKWYNITDNNTIMMYPIEYAKWFEPYVVCKTVDLHQYFPAFRGYGLNKNTFFSEANIRNFTHSVLTRQFVVHMNHKGRSSRNKQNNTHLGPMFDSFAAYIKSTYNVTL